MTSSNATLDQDFHSAIRILQETFEKKNSLKESEISKLRSELSKKDALTREQSLQIDQLESQLERAEKRIQDMSKAISKLTTFRKNIMESLQNGSLNELDSLAAGIGIQDWNTQTIEKAHYQTGIRNGIVKGSHFHHGPTSIPNGTSSYSNGSHRRQNSRDYPDERQQQKQDAEINHNDHDEYNQEQQPEVRTSNGNRNLNSYSRSSGMSKFTSTNHGPSSSSKTNNYYNVPLSTSYQEEKSLNKKMTKSLPASPIQGIKDYTHSHPSTKEFQSRKTTSYFQKTQDFLSSLEDLNLSTKNSTIQTTTEKQEQQQRSQLNNDNNNNNSNNNNCVDLLNTNEIIDGRSFFKEARLRLSFDDFSNLVWNVKALNARQQTKAATLDNVSVILGAKNVNLLPSFENLIATSSF